MEPPNDWPIVQKAINNAFEAAEQEKKGNYERAAELYERSVGFLCDAMKKEAECNEARDAISSKCQLCQNKVTELREYIEKQKFVNK